MIGTGSMTGGPRQSGIRRASTRYGSVCGEVEYVGVSFHAAPPPQTGTSRELQERIVITDIVDIATGQ